MPELPEITLSKEFIESHCRNKKIKEVIFPSTKLLQASKTDFSKALKGSKLEEFRRFGKYLFVRSAKKIWLVFHFGMTGKLVHLKEQDPPKYTHMLLTFEDHSSLAFLCRRELGKIFLTDSIEGFRKEHDLAKDALDFTKKDFENLLHKKKGGIKAVLTDQHSIAGIGNVYSDEILYQSGIHPKTKIEKLNEKEKDILYHQIPKVLKTAIKLGGKGAKFPSDYLIERRREGADCPKCRGQIEMTKVSGRSSYFCPVCQKEKIEAKTSLQLFLTI